MRDRKLSIGLRVTLAIFTATLLVAGTRAVAQEEKVLHSFNGKNGAIPYAGLIFDASGNLYGTTYSGGKYHDGAVFELTPKAGGGWTEKVLYSFSGNNGAKPHAGLIFDASGNLYGTTLFGGAHGRGTVFELTPTAGGGWTETLLYSFDGKNGKSPHAGLIFDASGNLYGTTYHGGKYDEGTVFELTPTAGGGWTEKVLHSFNGNNGAYPWAGLIFDAAGNLYGTTSAGGAYLYYGTVFELTPKAGGGWTEKVLHSFNDTFDGIWPYAGLIFDASGNLYGTTAYGDGGPDGGAVFELAHTPGGGWTEKLLYQFAGYYGGASNPYAGLIFDAAGNLYGTTESGGAHGDGTVFELTPTAGGGWTETLLCSFDGKNGKIPYAGLIFDAAGNLYGTTILGGAHDDGTVFEVTP